VSKYLWFQIPFQLDDDDPGDNSSIKHDVKGRLNTIPKLSLICF
jgi:hypothetical protein